MKRFLLFNIGALIISGPSGAVEIQDCSVVDFDTANIAEPFEENLRPYANGNVQLMVVDTNESVVGAFHLLVFSPPYDEFGKGGCKGISYGAGVGFDAVSLKEAGAQYDPKTGLSLELPVAVRAVGMNEGLLSLTLNQATGQIKAEIIFD